MPELSSNAIAEAIKAVLLTVPKIGKVHDYQRSIVDETTMHDHMFDETQNRICGWQISPNPVNTLTVERQPGYHAIGSIGGGSASETSTWQIEAYFGHDDENASQKTFHALVLLVVRTLNKYGGLPGIPGLTLQQAANLEQFGWVLYAGMYHTHYARITIAFQGQSRH
jgi:hypothetical protein